MITRGSRVTLSKDYIAKHGGIEGYDYDVLSHDTDEGKWVRLVIGGISHIVDVGSVTVVSHIAEPAVPPARYGDLIGKTDPNGLDAHTAGAKLDAGKLQPLLILRDMSRALTAVIKIASDGAVKYTPGGWIKVDNAQVRYEDAGLRHMLLRHGGETRDRESKSLHLAHEAWNALAQLELYLRENPDESVS